MTTMTIPVPREYLEDVRSALVVELVSVVEMLKTNQDAVLDPTRDDAVAVADRDATIPLVRRDVDLLEALADGRLEGSPDGLWRIFEELAAVLSDRLREAYDCAPIDFEGAREAMRRLGWSMEQLAKIEAEFAAGVA